MIKKVKEIKQSEKYIHIKQSLLDQLEAQGKNSAFYVDLVDDYMDFYTTKTRLIDNVHNKGVMIKYDNGGGQKGQKKNDAIELALKVNRQMLTLLDYLNAKDDEGIGCNFKL